MNDTTKHITVSRVVDHPAKEIFSVLTLPARHHEFDGTGTVRAADDTERITKAGEQFMLNMEGESTGDYRLRNHVTAFDENRMIGWQPAPADETDDAPGWEWLYTLKSLGSDSTEVTLTYDWEKVEDKDLLPQLPAVSEEQLEETLNKLAAAVMTP